MGGAKKSFENYRHITHKSNHSRNETKRHETDLFQGWLCGAGKKKTPGLKGCLWIIQHETRRQLHCQSQQKRNSCHCPSIQHIFNTVQTCCCVWVSHLSTCFRRLPQRQREQTHDLPLLIISTEMPCQLGVRVWMKVELSLVTANWELVWTNCGPSSGRLACESTVCFTFLDETITILCNVP